MEEHCVSIKQNNQRTALADYSSNQCQVRSGGEAIIIVQTAHLQGNCNNQEELKKAPVA